MARFVCATCAAQFPDSEQPPDGCPICTDERQYVAGLRIDHYEGSLEAGLAKFR